METNDPRIRRHPNGSIDLHYYDRRARVIRGAAATGVLKAFREWFRTMLVSRVPLTPRARQAFISLQTRRAARQRSRCRGVAVAPTRA